MPGGDGIPDGKNPPSAYEEALEALSSLIIRRVRADGSNRSDHFDVMFDYLKILDLEGPISEMKVIHVAGTKGKGSTCTFTESILRNCGFHTGLFTSPHLIDVRERFRLDGFVHGPVVCGISSLGYDHMEILGNTLGEIAGEKAGIFKQGVPAFTVPQPEEAMSVLENKARQLGVPLQVAQPLDILLLNGLQLGIDGDHQYTNAGLAIALCHTWLQMEGHIEGTYIGQRSLPEEFVKGLATATLQGRSQIVSDMHMYMQNSSNSKCGGLVFFLDGAHSPESMEMCAKWFSNAVNEDIQQHILLDEKLHCGQSTEQDLVQNHQNKLTKEDFSAKSYKQILLFNCMSVRDPQLLLPRLINTCSFHGIHFHKALFVPNQSLFNKVRSPALPMSDPPKADLSWQLELQRVWENLVHGDRGGKDTKPSRMAMGYESSSVLTSLPLALKWLRDHAQEKQSVRFQVLVTGSLHLVGDMLRLLRK